MSGSITPPEAGAAWSSANAARIQRPRAVELRNVGVHYDRATRTERHLGTILADVVRRRRADGRWALRNIDLDVHAGECIAIIGSNGAGKTTLLRVIAGLLAPDSGYVRVRGRASALLNLGVGFDPRLSGRENVLLMGALLGLSAARTRDRMDEVLEFADIADFIDAPLRAYSSGMRARLGFAAAVTMVDPNVLILDEVMGTGDAAFREKSKARVNELVSEAHAVVLATHDMTWVTEFATYAVLIHGGRLVAEGAPSGVTALYRAGTVLPPRRYDCPGCAGSRLGSACLRCGVFRHPDPPAPFDSVTLGRPAEV